MSKQTLTYIYFIIALGFFLIGITLLPYEFQPLDFWFVLLFSILSAILDRYTVELPNGTIYSGSLSYSFTILFLFGIPHAIFIEVLNFIFNSKSHSNQPMKEFYNLAQYCICIYITGTLLGFIQNGTHSLLENIFIAVLGIGIFILINLGILTYLRMQLQGNSYFSILFNMLHDSLYGYAVTTLLSLLLIYISKNSSYEVVTVTVIFVTIFFLLLRYSFSLFINLRKTYLQTLEKMLSIKEAKRTTKKGHAARVGKLAQKIAEHMNLPQEEIDTISYAAFLHDIGKLKLNTGIYEKKGPLTLDEQTAHEKHPLIGAEMVSEITGLEKASVYIKHHHETWKGNGFPDQLKENDIPIGSRVIAAANLYDHTIQNDKIADKRQAFLQMAEGGLDPEITKAVVELVDFSIPEPSEQIEDTILEEQFINAAHQKWEQSHLLSKFGVNIRAVFNGEFFTDEQQQMIELPNQIQLTRLSKKTIEDQTHHREIIESEDGKIYDVYTMPSGQNAQVLIFEVNHLLEYELNQEEKIKQFYRDVLFAATQGKLLLIDKEDLEHYQQTAPLYEATIETKADVPKCRHIIRDILHQHSVQDEKEFQILVSVSEIVTNVIKHAVSGKMKVYVKDDVLTVMIEDEGDGIDLKDLPKSTMLEGFSSKKSLGYGFALILRWMDKVILHTNTDGTSIIMEIKIKDESKTGSAHIPTTEIGEVSNHA